MKSQKQRNRPPRPFKASGNDRGWSGGNFIPMSHKPVPRVVKAKEAPPVAKGECEADASASSESAETQQ